MSNILTPIKEGIQSYCNTQQFQSNVDTEILDLLDNCNYRSISEISSVQTCVFSTLYCPFPVGMYKDVSKYHQQRDYLQNGKKRQKLIVIHISKYCVIFSFSIKCIFVIVKKNIPFELMQLFRNTVFQIRVNE